MGTLQLAIFILIIPYFRAVNALAQSPTYLDAQNEKNNNPLTLPLSLVDTTTTAQTDLIVTDNNNPAPCSSSVYNPITGGRLKRRGGGKQRRGGANNKNSESSTCPSPATITTPTDTDTSPSNKPDEQQQQQQQQPQTEAEKKGPGAAHDDGSPKPDEQLNWPNLFKIPTKDGDNPACFQVTNGLMPVGVCENPTLQPEPSRWDVFMKVNHDIYPRAWKLPDSQLAWPGARECVPSNSLGIWCCRFYTVLIDGSGFGDICWPLKSIERLNRKGLSDWQQYMNPLLFPGL